MRVRLTKIGINHKSECIQSSSIQEYRESLENAFEGKSPPIDYYTEGKALAAPRIGSSFILDRDNRNGIKIKGVVQTSKIIAIEDLEDVIYLTTQNSVYKLEQAPREPKYENTEKR